MRLTSCLQWVALWRRSYLSRIHVTQNTPVKHNTTAPPSGECVSNMHHIWKWLLKYDWPSPPGMTLANEFVIFKVWGWYWVNVKHGLCLQLTSYCRVWGGVKSAVKVRYRTQSQWGCHSTASLLNTSFKPARLWAHLRAPETNCKYCAKYTEIWIYHFVVCSHFSHKLT